jgi:hypothetical protein
VKLNIPLFVNPVPRVTYYTLSLDAERCPSFSLFHAYEKNDVCLSPALRPCDFQNNSAIALKDHNLAAVLAEFAEPVMKRRYGNDTVVEVLECSCPEKMAIGMPFDEHAKKAQIQIDKFQKANAPRSSESKLLKSADVTTIR